MEVQKLKKMLKEQKQMNGKGMHQGPFQRPACPSFWRAEWLNYDVMVDGYSS